MSEEIYKEGQTSKKKRSLFGSAKSRIILAVVIIIFAVVAVKGIAMARHIGKFSDGPHGFMIEMISEKLNLSADQKAQVERIRDQIKERTESKKPSHEGMMDELANEFKKDKMDRNKLIELSNKRDIEKQEMKDFMMDKLMEFHDLLTPEQRNKAVETMKEFREMKGDKMKMFKERKDIPQHDQE